MNHPGGSLNEPTIHGDADSVWDRVWRGRASSIRRNLANFAGQAARIATLVAEGARLVDRLPDKDRQVEVLGIADELDELADVTKDAAKILRVEAGRPVRARPGFWARLLGG